MKFFRASAGTAAALALALAVLGSWVRINGAGMTCPDWPLCRGALVPALIGGVVLEWTHRLIAALVGFVIIAAFVAGWRARRAIAGVGPTLIALVSVFALQVAVGGITIHESNSPRSVALHWGVAMALLATLIVLALLAFLAPAPGRGPSLRAGAPIIALGIATACAYVTMCIGSYVSSSGAGLACSTVPGCDGSWTGDTLPQSLQMAHRFAAATFFVTALVAASFVAQTAMARARAWTFAGLALVVLQIGLGVANVVWRMPTLLRELHAANAAVTFLAFVVATFFATLDPVDARVPITKGLSVRRAV